MSEAKVELQDDQIFLVSAQSTAGQEDGHPYGPVIQRVVVAESTAVAIDLLNSREPALYILSVTSMADYRRAIDLIQKAFDPANASVPLIISPALA